MHDDSRRVLLFHKEKKMRRLTLIVASGLIAVAASGTAMADPIQSVSPDNHPELAAAQQLIGQAFYRVRDAQVANHDEMGGHAARAKALLEQASQEIRQAAIAANGNR
ncbi:hypothetical protein [Burkholderia diffusa]|uniref:hypothetical protein n=1 Tax=Burkholderia diffusa TaxID=488732 RepID=UPI00157ABFD2|nr:hypothetical protein [Burkholderia diffusa]NTY38219.1 hypothetical protein [Burkholderia diffusa]